MKRIGVVLSLALVGSLGFVGGEAFSSTQEAPNYLVMTEFEIGPDQTFNDAINRLSEWVRVSRATGKHESVRLFLHDWGPEAGLYILYESDWEGVGEIFPDIVAGIPGFMDQPFGFVGHSDNIMTEIVVD